MNTTGTSVDTPGAKFSSSDSLKSESSPSNSPPYGVPLTWSQVWLYGIGEIPVTATMVLFGLFVLFFYNSVMGLSAPLAGVGFGAGLVLDAAIDPWIGYRSDRSRHRLGRRRSFILVGAITMGACFALIFCPPPSLGKTGLFLWLMVCSMLYRFTAAVYRIPYLSLGAELSQDYDKRTVIIGVRSICGLAGALLGALSFVLFFRAGVAGADPKLAYANYPRMGLSFGALLTVAGLIAFFGTANHRDSLVRETASRGPGFFSGFLSTMSNRAFRSVWLSFTVFYGAVIINASLALNFLIWCAGLRDSGVLSAAQAGFGVGACVGVLLWIVLAKRGEKRTWYAVGTLGTALMLASATLFIGPGRPFGVGRAWPMIGGYLLAGIFASALWVLPASMVADVADQDQLAGGARREGVYFGMLNFGEKVASGFAVLAGGFFLQYYVHLVPASTTQTALAVSRLSIIYGLIPGLLLLGSVALILPYSLSRNAVREIQRGLAGREQSGDSSARTPLDSVIAVTEN